MRAPRPPNASRPCQPVQCNKKFTVASYEDRYQFIPSRFHDTPIQSELSAYATRPKTRARWDSLQIEYSCCGGFNAGYKDWKGLEVEPLPIYAEEYFLHSKEKSALDYIVQILSSTLSSDHGKYYFPTSLSEAAGVISRVARHDFGKEGGVNIESSSTNFTTTAVPDSCCIRPYRGCGRNGHGRHRHMETFIRWVAVIASSQIVRLRASSYLTH